MGAGQGRKGERKKEREVGRSGEREYENENECMGNQPSQVTELVRG